MPSCIDVPTGSVHVDRTCLEADDGDPEDKHGPVDLSPFVENISASAHDEVDDRRSGGADQICDGQRSERIEIVRR